MDVGEAIGQQWPERRMMMMMMMNVKVAARQLGTQKKVSLELAIKR